MAEEENIIEEEVGAEEEDVGVQEKTFGEKEIPLEEQEGELEDEVEEEEEEEVLDEFWLDEMRKQKSSEYDSWFDLEEGEEEGLEEIEEEEEETVVEEAEEEERREPKMKEEIKEKEKIVKGKLSAQQEKDLLMEISKQPGSYRLRPVILPEISEDEMEMKELGQKFLEIKEMIKPKIKELRNFKKFKPNSRKYEFDKYIELLESSSQEATSTSVAQMRHRITSGPTIVYFLQEKDAQGKYSMRPIRLPLENAQTSRIFKEMPVYRRLKFLTEEEKKECLAVSVAGRGANVAEDDKDEAYFQVQRKVPVIVVRGTVTVKKKDEQGNVIEEVHEAGFEYPEEDEEELPNKGLYHNNYLEPPKAIQEPDESDIKSNIVSIESNSEDEASSVGILWEKGIIVKVSERRRLINLKPYSKPEIRVGKLSYQEKEKRVKLCSYLLIYTQLLGHLKKRSHDLTKRIKQYIKVNEKKDSPTARKRYKKLFLKNILHYRDIRDKFLSAVTSNIEIIEKIYKSLDEAILRYKSSFLKFVELERVLLSMVDPVVYISDGGITKDKIQHIFKTKMLLMLSLKEDHVSYLKKLQTLAHLVTERRDLETAHQKMDLDKYHETINKKKELEDLVDKSNASLQELHETYLRAVKNIIFKFDDKDKFIEKKAVYGLDDISDFAERRRIKLLQIKQQRSEKNALSKKPVKERLKKEMDKSMEKKQMPESNRWHLPSASNLMKY